MTANIGHNTQIQRSDDGTSGGSFATVGVIYDLTPPAISRETVDVTSMGSNERWREFIGGMKDGGEFSCDVEFDPGEAVTTSFLADLNTNTPGYYKIIFPDDGSTEWGFAALLTGFDPSAPLEGRMMASCTFKLTGKPGFIA